MLREILSEYALSLDKLDFVAFEESVIFNKYNSIKVFNKGRLIAVFGEVHPKILREQKLIRLDKIKRSLFYLEINFSELITK